MRLISAIVALSMLASPALAASASGGVTTTILSPLSVSTVQSLSFGSLQRPAVGSGSATVGTDGSLTLTGAVGSSGPHSAATFTISGEKFTTVVVSVDPTVTLINTTGGGGETLTATTSNDLPSGNSPQLSGFGTYTVHVGASVPVTSASVSGAYVGTVNITAVYP